MQSTGTYFAASQLAGSTPSEHVLSRSIGLQVCCWIKRFFDFFRWHVLGLMKTWLVV
uniref:Uncharacterized protein n=1 Tax=Nelumbo nucifera TaxID=4432 RepID=A0A822YX12_NELNU|nr:TPA_asm: hypothetical protein HUJ06_007718 [Nelumbo nucifera]